MRGSVVDADRGRAATDNHWRVQGEAFTADEAAKMMAVCMDGAGRVWYEDFARALTMTG